MKNGITNFDFVTARHLKLCLKVEAAIKRNGLSFFYRDFIPSKPTGYSNGKQSEEQSRTCDNLTGKQK